MTGGARRGILALVLTTALWGVSFPLIGEAVGARSAGAVFAFLAMRFTVAGLGFLPVARPLIASARGRGLRPWTDAGLAGVLLFGGFALQTLGLVHTTPARSAFITMLSVLLVPFLAAAWHRRRPSLPHVLGCAGALAGLAVVMSPGGEFQPNVGDTLTFACALVFGLHVVALERVTRRSPILVIAFGQIVAVAVLAALALVFLDFRWPEEWPGLGRAVLVTGFVCTTLALGLMVFGQARVPAEVAAVIFALEPVWAAGFEWAYLGTSLGPEQWVGGLVVVASVAFASGAPVRAAPHP